MPSNDFGWQITLAEKVVAITGANRGNWSGNCRGVLGQLGQGHILLEPDGPR